ncbi:MAG TPA: prolyl oligopeptidase family serine peptidase, partial [Allosphingosinicella sp.]|nr:prolyl oligopeptidase family serine peptidase [Allosphingosinicella sp.]
FISWQDQVSLPPPAAAAPGAPPGRSLRRYAAATVSSAEARDALVSLGSMAGYQLWLNGALAGEGPGAPAYYPDAAQHPVRLRAGENRLVLELMTAAGANFSARMLEPGTALPPRRAIAPALRVESEALEILTDAAGTRTGLRLDVTAHRPGGGVLGQAGADWGATARLPTAAWPDGPVELHVSGRDQWGQSVSAWLRWHKGNWREGARRLAAAAAAPRDPAGDRLRFLAALIADQPDNADRAAGLLFEQAELAGDAAIRGNGFVRLAWTDPVDGTTQFCRAYLPEGYAPDRRWPLTLYLHGFHPQNPIPIRWWGVDTRHVPEAERYGTIWLEPHGRGNMDWREAGEDDVLRCIEAARRRFSVDADRIYLTGLSMGGAGTWTIASHFPGLFAAIVPIFGGWDYRLVGRDGWSDAAATWPVERWHQENQSRFTGVESLNATPIFVIHGDRDEAVPVAHSRYVVPMLQRWGYDLRYEEIPGRGHEELDARDRFVPWLLAHRRTAAPRVARVRAMSLREASAWWLSVTEYERPLEAIEARAEVLEPGVVRVDSRNAAGLSLRLPTHLRGTSAPRLIWNGEARTGARQIGDAYYWRLRPVGEAAAPRKSRSLPGGMSDIFRTPFLIVHGPGAAEQAAAQRVAAIWRGAQHQEPRLALDRETSEAMLRDHSLILIGGPRENLIARRAAAQLPMRVDAGGVTILGRRFAAPDSVGQMLRPSPFASGRYVLAIAAASPAAMARWDAYSLWNAPYGSPAQPLDWTVGAVADSPRVPLGLDPSRGWVASGVFGADWGLDPRWIFSGAPPAH